MSIWTILLSDHSVLNVEALSAGDAVNEVPGHVIGVWAYGTWGLA
jgi:hypothetical protein